MTLDQRETDLRRDRSRLRLLEERATSLRREREVAETLRKHNLKAVEQTEDTDAKEVRLREVERRYEQEVAAIDAALMEAEEEMRDLRSRLERKTGRILLVDDEKNIRLTVSEALKPLGMPVETAADGESALKKLAEEDFTVLLLDLKMPGIDGMTVLDEVQRRWPKTRVIILTAHGTIDTAVETMKLGAVEFIRKPFSPREIRELVETVLGERSRCAPNHGNY